MCAGAAVLAAIAWMGLASLAGADRDGALLTVRGHAAIDLDPIRRADEGISVRGTLADRATGEAIAARGIVVTAGEAWVDARTDSAGHFEATLKLGEAPGEEARDLRVAFPGTRHYAATEVTLPDIDPRARPLELEIEAPAVVTTEAGESAVLRARSENEPVSTKAEIMVGPDADHLEHLADVDIRDGGAEIPISGAALGPPGRVLLVAAASGGDTHDAARAEAHIVARASTRLALSVPDKPLRIEDRIEMRGALRKADGRAVPHAPVDIEEGGRRLARARTDASGAFSASISADALGPGEFALEARFEPNVPWLAASRSAPVAIAVGEGPAIPRRYTLAAFAGAALLSLVFAGARALPIRRLRALASRGRRAAEPTRGRDRSPAAGNAGLKPAPRRARRAQRPRDFALAGTIIDAVTRHPVAGSRIDLGGHGPGTALSDANGAFSVDLETGRFSVEISAPGYVTARFEARVPHRGELRGFEVGLSPVKEEIFSRYREVAEPLLPPDERWGAWTPRQIVSRVWDSRPAPALAALTERVEQAYFSPRIPQESEIPAIDAAVRAAREEQASGDSGVTQLSDPS